jgi:hypothetical protein
MDKSGGLCTAGVVAVGGGVSRAEWYSWRVMSSCPQGLPLKYVCCRCVCVRAHLQPGQCSAVAAWQCCGGDYSGELPQLSAIMLCAVQRAEAACCSCIFLGTLNTIIAVSLAKAAGQLGVRREDFFDHECGCT